MVEKPKVKIKKESEINEKLDLMIVNRCPLKNICNNNELINKINQTVFTVNKIVIQIYQFLNLYLIYKYNKKEDFPKIDDIFIKAIIKIITKRKDKRGKPPNNNTKILKKELKDFYENQYKQ